MFPIKNYKCIIQKAPAREYGGFGVAGNNR